MGVRVETGDMREVIPRLVAEGIVCDACVTDPPYHLTPTVKPVELIRYLVKLVCPPGGTFIDPFAGSGTAGVAALAEGRNAILIEREAEYLADIRERMAHYEGEGRHSLVSKSRKRAPAKPEGLFADWPAA